MVNDRLDEVKEFAKLKSIEISEKFDSQTEALMCVGLIKNLVDAASITGFIKHFDNQK